MLQPDATDFDPEPAADPVSTAALARGVAERQIAVLDRLAEAGTRMAEAVAQKAAEASASEIVAGLDVALQKVGRAVRLSLALQTKILKDLAALERGEVRMVAGPPAVVVEQETPLDQRRRRIGRIVGRVVADDEEDDDEVERLSSQAWERLSDEDIYGDILARPMGEIVELICRDLEIPVNWVRLSREAWATQEMAEGHPNSPFVRYAADLALGDSFEPPPRGGGP